jgi:hypothetical protein
MIMEAEVGTKTHSAIHGYIYLKQSFSFTAFLQKSVQIG